MYQQHTGKLALMTAFIFAACSDTTAPADDALLDADIALVAADAALEDLQMMNTGFGGLGSAPAPLATPPREISRTVIFFDANGNVQEAYDPHLTASIDIVADMSGEVTRDTWTAEITRHRELTITGLLGDETSRTWNGNGNGSVERSQHDDDGGTRSYDMTSTSVITNVVRGIPREDNPYPLSGTITRDISVTIVNGPNGDETRQRTAVITFDGTQFATLTVNGETLQVDLAAREGRHPIRGHR